MVSAVNIGQSEGAGSGVGEPIGSDSGCSKRIELNSIGGIALGPIGSQRGDCTAQAVAYAVNVATERVVGNERFDIR